MSETWSLENLPIEEEVIKIPNSMSGEIEEWLELTASLNYISKIRITPEAQELPEAREEGERRLREVIIREHLKNILHYIENNGKQYDFVSVQGSYNSIQGITYETPITEETLIILHPEKMVELAILRPFDTQKVNENV